MYVSQKTRTPNTIVFRIFRAWFKILSSADKVIQAFISLKKRDIYIFMLNSFVENDHAASAGIEIMSMQQTELEEIMPIPTSIYCAQIVYICDIKLTYL